MANEQYAFPLLYGCQHGMTLRDWFAGQALVGLSADNANGAAIHFALYKKHGEWDFETVAKDCYALADAMLVARERKNAEEDENG